MTATSFLTLCLCTLLGCAAPMTEPPKSLVSLSNVNFDDSPSDGSIFIKVGSGTLTDFDFGNVRVGSTSVTLALVITNDTPELTGVLDVALGGSNPARFQLLEPATDCNDDLVLAPDAFCAVRLRFVPDQLGATSGTLDVLATPGGSASLQLTGTGVAGPRLSLSPPFRDFGVIEFGQPQVQTFMVTNQGPDVTINQVATTNGIGAGFSLGSTTCSGVLLNTSTCTLDVRFDPATFGQNGGDVVITTDLGEVSQGLNFIMGYGGARVDVTKDGTGSGTVTSDGGGAPNVDCGTACSGIFITPAHVLTATPDNGNTFVGWSDASCGAAPTCAVTASITPSAITATFNEIP